MAEGDGRVWVHPYNRSASVAVTFNVPATCAITGIVTGSVTVTVTLSVTITVAVAVVVAVPLPLLWGHSYCSCYR